MFLRKVLVLPTVLDRNTVYIVKSTDPLSSLDYNTLHVVDNTGSTAYSGISLDMVGTHVDSKLVSYSAAASSTKIHSDWIAMNNAPRPTKNEFAHVLSAHDDPTVDFGGATYLYNVVTDTYIKVSEFESMDTILDWSMIVNKPVYASLLSVNASGRLTFDGEVVAHEDSFVQEW